MSIDPLAEKYPDWAPYVFSGNRIIDAVELEGLEPHKIYKTKDEAAKNFGQQYNGLSIRANAEIRTYFYTATDENGNTYYSYTTPGLGSEGMATAEPEPVSSEYEQIGEGHTHSADRNNEPEGVKDAYKYGDNYPSYQDLRQAYKNWKEKKKSDSNATEVMYVVTPNGTIYKFEPNDNTRNFDDDVKEVEGASKVVPSDPNSATRKNNISPNVTPEVLPNNIDKDDYEKIPE